MTWETLHIQTSAERALYIVLPSKEFKADVKVNLSTASPVPDRFQILALDGGGIKGIFLAAVLSAIEEDLGTTVAEHFDLIAGTSTGGIIAVGLGLGLSPRHILEFYLQECGAIFRNRLFAASARHLVRGNSRPSH
jgi:predicted acylesterase/phospholipase RssA